MSKNKYKKKVDELDVVDEVTTDREDADNETKSNFEDETVEKSVATVDKDDLDKELEENSEKNLEENLEENLEKKVSNSTDDYLAEIEGLKKSNETLLAENEDLKNELNVKEVQFSKSIKEIQINNAIEIAIREANGKNVKAIKALINFEEISLDSSGEVVGLSEQIEDLKTSESSSFLFNENELVLKGVTPVSSAKVSGISVTDFQKMSYKERLELYNKDASLYKTLKY